MKKKLFSFGKMFVALLFLFNPNINLIDVFPDAIGYLLLMLSIRNAAEIFPHFDEAHKGFLRLFWINIAKLPAFFIMYAIIGGNTYERAIITVFALSFFVLEILFAIPAFRALANGLVHMGEREGLLPMLRSGVRIETVSVITLLFLLIKGVLSFLPETALLSVFETLGSLDIGALNPAHFYPFFAVGGALISGAFGLFWLIITSIYVLSLRANSSVREFLQEKALVCEDKLTRSMQKNTKALGIYFLLAALLFAFDITLDDTNYLPDAISGLLFFFSLLILRKESKYTIPGMAIALGYAFSALLTNVVTALFLSYFQYSDVYYDVKNARLSYAGVTACAVIEALLLTALLIFVFLAFRNHIQQNVSPHMHKDNIDITFSIRKELTKKLTVFTVLGFLSAAYRVVETVLMAFFKKHVVTAAQANQYYAEGKTLYLPLFEGNWFISLLVTAAWVVAGIYFLYSLREETKETEELLK